jgi:hypothetical protein
MMIPFVFFSNNSEHERALKDLAKVMRERRWRALRMLLNPPADPKFFSRDTTGGEFVVRVFCGEVTRTPTVMLDGRYFVAN